MRLTAATPGRALGVLLGLLLLSVLGCSSDKTPPNIILLTLDTTRADHLGCYGHPGAVTPNLDRLAREGVRFAEARTPVPITLPSHTSILTGTYPPTHGVHLHTDPFEKPGIPTLAELLKQRGYQTAAFVAAKVLDTEFGLNRGFDFYDDDTGDAPDGSQAHAQLAEAVVQKARRWLDGKQKAPYFVWLHFFDPHMAYDPPEPYRSRFAASPYTGEIAYMDAQIGVFLDGLFPGNKLQNTIVIAIGDHGESLGEHGLIGHTEFVYREVLRIPFLLAWPGKIKGGGTVEELARSIDLMPTLLDLLDIKIPATVEGRSLRPLIEGQAEAQARTSFFESHYLENLFGWAPLLGIERSPHKLIRAVRSELYDSSADPSEGRNLYQAGDAVCGELGGLLDSFLADNAGAGGAGSQEEALDPRRREVLASLGYVSGDSRTRPSGADLEDPLDHLEAVRLYQRIQLGPLDGSTCRA
jgi:arylsulfatase A-like enzyme